MIVITKTEIIPVLVHFYNEKLNELYLKEYRFQNKYKISFENFEKKP